MAEDLTEDLVDEGEGEAAELESDVITRFRFAIEGVTPLVMHNTKAMLEPNLDKGRDHFAWEKAHYKEYYTHTNARGDLIVPAYAFRKMLINGCKFMVGRPKGTRLQSYAAFIEGALIPEDDGLLNRPMQDVEPWVTIVSLDPSKGTRSPKGPRCRPLIPLPWRAEITALAMDGVLTRDVLQKLANRAGRLCGLLDARPLGMGRCLISVEELEAAA